MFIPSEIKQIVCEISVNFLDPLLKESCLSVLSKFVASEAHLKKSKIKSFFNLSDAKDEEINVIKTGLSALIQAPDETDPRIYKEIFMCSKNKNDEVAKQSLILLNKLCPKNYHIILPNLKKLIPKFTTENVNGFDFAKFEKKDDTLNLTDNYGRLALTKISKHAFIYENPLTNENSQPFIVYLKYMIHDRKISIFYEAVNILSQNYDALMKDYSLPNIPNSLDTIINRYLILLRVFSNHQILLFSLLRSIHQFVKSIINYSLPSSIYQIFSKVKTFLYKGDRYIRLYAYKILLSSPSLEISKDAIIRLKVELKSNQIWNKYDVFTLINSFFETSKAKIENISLLTDIISHICIYYPEKVDKEYLEKIWDLFKHYPSIIEYFLKMLYIILDESLRGSKQSLEIIDSIYTFLGENANMLTRENDPNKNVQEKGLIKDLSKNLDELYQIQDVFEIQNMALKSIVLRMIKGSMYSHTRLACVEGLGKIAIRSQDPTRLYILEFLIKTKDDDFSTSFYSEPIIKLLCDIYNLRIEISQLDYNNEKQILKLWEDHENIKERANLFCILKDWTPLGNESKLFFGKVNEILMKQKK